VVLEYPALTDASLLVWILGQSVVFIFMLLMFKNIVYVKYLCRPMLLIFKDIVYFKYLCRPSPWPIIAAAICFYWTGLLLWL